jgi:hypothetical protein
MADSSDAGRRSAAPAWAAAIYVAAWLVGLAIWPSNLAVSASGAKVVRTYSAHQAVGAAQFVLVEGIAAIALAVVVVALARAIRPAAPDRARVALVTGLTACLISIAQCALGVVLATALASPAHVGAADDVFDAINRLDGVKMFLLAALIGTAALAHRELGTPSWLRVVSLLAILALLVSGVGYLVLDDLLANAAFVSGPLLLVWVSATGLALSRPRNLETVSPAASG